MNDDEDIFRLPEDETPLVSGRSARLDSIKKQRTLESAESLRKPRETELRVVTETPSNGDEQEPVLLANEKKRSLHEGKSVEFTIDEILQNKKTAEDATEKDWGAENKTIPIGWLITLSAGMLTLIAVIVYLISNTHIKESKLTQGRQIQVIEKLNTSDDAQILVATIEKTVRSYLAASTIDEKLKFVRHADSIKPRMESFYATTPLEPLECRNVTNLKPITLDGRAFWQVIAITGEKKGQAILIEQLIDNQIKVDWESHVYYQPMPWEQYAKEKPIPPMAFRVGIKESTRYFGEFSDSIRWASYELSAANSEKILYGYVLRNSPTHQAIQQAQQQGFKRMIIRLQASAAIKIADSVVIESFVSSDLYRLHPPKTLID